MIKRKIQDKRRYLLAFLIATFIFINVFFFTYSISYFEYRRISNEQQQLSYGIFRDKLYFSLFEKNNCSSNYLDKISEDLNFHGSMIEALEKKLGKTNEKVLFAKKFYSLIELEHFEFIKEMNRKCGFNLSTILFFYSNYDDIKNSERIGRLLDSVFIRNKNLIIYSFDLNLDDELIRGLKELYAIKEPSTIVINEKVKLVNPKTVEDVERYLPNT